MQALIKHCTRTLRNKGRLPRWHGTKRLNHFSTNFNVLNEHSTANNFLVLWGHCWQTFPFTDHYQPDNFTYHLHVSSACEYFRCFWTGRLTQDMEYYVIMQQLTLRMCLNGLVFLRFRFVVIHLNYRLTVTWKQELNHKSLRQWDL